MQVWKPHAVKNECTAIIYRKSAQYCDLNGWLQPHFTFCTGKVTKPSSLHIPIVAKVHVCVYKFHHCSFVFHYNEQGKCVRQHYGCLLVATSPSCSKCSPLEKNTFKKRRFFGSFCLLRKTVVNTWITRLDMSQIKNNKTLVSCCFSSRSMTRTECLHTQLLHW